MYIKENVIGISKRYPSRLCLGLIFRFVEDFDGKSNRYYEDRRNHRTEVKSTISRSISLMDLVSCFGGLRSAPLYILDQQVY